MLVGLGLGVGRVSVRFGIVLRLPAQKTLDMDGRGGVWYASDALMWVPLGAVCVGGSGGVLWLGILLRFARGDGGSVVMHLFLAWICGISIGYVLGGEVWWLVGEVVAIGTSRNFASASLPPCSLRMYGALCGVGVSWMVHN